MNDQPFAVRARGLTKNFRRGDEVVHALAGVDLTINAGEVVAMAGPSGSGKSTLLAILAGWDQPDAGALHITDGRGDGAPWSRIGVVPQALGLLEELTLADNASLPARLGGVPEMAERVDELFEALDLTRIGQRMPREASLGEQQRAAVARALLLTPTLVLADEPTSHQDHARGQRILALLREAAAQGSAVVVASHDPDTLDAADRVLHLRDGVVLEQYGVTDLREHGSDRA